MRSSITITLAAVMMLGFAGPGHAEDGKGDGLAGACRNLMNGEMEQQVADFRKMDREELWPAMLETIEGGEEAFAEFSDGEQEVMWLEWHEALIDMPAVMLSFCDYFKRGAVPDIGTGKGHGSVIFGREFVYEKDGEKKPADLAAGGNDCEKPYSATLELEGRRTKHIFRETASGFALTSSYRADGADGWAKIE